MVNETKKVVYEACRGGKTNGKVCGTLVPLEKIGMELGMVKAWIIELARVYDDLYR